MLDIRGGSLADCRSLALCGAFDETAGSGSTTSASLPGRTTREWVRLVLVSWSSGPSPSSSGPPPPCCSARASSRGGGRSPARAPSAATRSRGLLTERRAPSAGSGHPHSALRTHRSRLLLDGVGAWTPQVCGRRSRPDPWRPMVHGRRASPPCTAPPTPEGPASQRSERAEQDWARPYQRNCLGLCPFAVDCAGGKRGEQSQIKDTRTKAKSRGLDTPHSRHDPGGSVGRLAVVDDPLDWNGVTGKPVRGQNHHRPLAGHAHNRHARLDD